MITTSLDGAITAATVAEAPPVFASALPQSTASPLVDEFNAPWLEQQAEKAKAAREKRETFFKTLDAALLDSESFFQKNPPDLRFGGDPDKTKRMILTQAYLRASNGGKPPAMGADGYDLLRARVAHQRFGGKGALDADEFHGEIVKEAQGRKDASELEADLLDSASTSAFVGSVGEGAPTFQAWREEARKKPGYKPGNDAEHLEVWHEVQQAEKERIAPFRDELAAVWKAMKAGGAGSASTIIKELLPFGSVDGNDLVDELQKKDAGAVAFEVYDKLDEEERADFMVGLHTLVKTFPKEERPAILANLAKTGGRMVDDLARGAASRFSVKGMEEALNRQMAGSVGPFSPSDEDKAKAGANADRIQADRLAQKNWVDAIRDIERTDYAPVRHLSKASKDVFSMRTAEEGLYGVPGVFASVATVMTPGVGPAAMYLAMEDFAYRDLRDNLKRDGMGEAEASAVANRYKSAAAIPQTALEIVQTYAPLGKLPAVNRALIKLGDGIKNRLVRGAVKAAAISGAETLTEEGQFLTPYVVQDIASAFEKDMPDANWTGEGGAFDGFWTRQATVFLSMLPLAMGGAAGGLNREARAAAFARASTTELQAFGGTAEGIGAVNGANGPSSLNAAVDIFMATRDPNTPEAQAAVEVLAAELAERQATLEAAKASGIVPDIIGNARDGYTVLDGETKEEIGTAPDRAGAMRIATAHSAALDDSNADKIAYLASMLEAGEEALAMAGDANAKTSAELGTLYTEALAAAENPASIDQFAAQAADKEVVNGGTGDVSRVAIGRNVAEVRGQVRTFTNRLFQGASVRTVVHETGHGMLRRAWESGSVTREETLKFVQSVNAEMGERKLKRGAFAGEALALLDETAYAAADAAGKDRMLHEAVAEILEAEVMRTRKRVIDKKSLPMSRGVVTRGVFSAALLRLAPKLAGKFKALVEAVRGVVGLSSPRALLIKKGIREGRINESEYEGFLDKLTGRDHQAEHNAMASEEAAALVGEAELEADADFEVDEDNPFSLAPVIRSIDNTPGGDTPFGDERQRNPAAVLEGITSQGDGEGGLRTDGTKRRKHGRILATGEDLARWASENGRVLNSEAILAIPDLVPIGGGEHRVLFDEESGRVLKLTKPGFFGAQGEDAGAYLKRWDLHNKAFGDNVAFEGIVTLAGETEQRAVISQEFAVGRDATPEEQSDYLISKGFYEMSDGRWIHPVRGIVAWDTITPGNAILTEGGVRIIDLQMAPAPAGDLRTLRERTGIRRETAFSLAPAAMVDSMSLNAAARIKDPRAKAAVFTRMLDKLGQLKRDKDELGIAFGKGYKRKAIEDPRKTASIRKERNFREAARRAELEDETHARHNGILHTEDLDKLKAQPVHGFLADPDSPLRGRLMSQSAAAAKGKTFFDPQKQGDYDGAGAASRSLFGGQLMPDQAAQELFDNGLINQPTPDAMWDALAREAKTVASMKDFMKAAEADLRKARQQAKEEATAWEWERLKEEAANYSPRQRLLRSLAMLDGIIAVLPIAERGRIGGYTQLAKLGSDEARLKFLNERIAKVDEVVEAWLKKEYTRMLDRLLERAKPAKGKAGEKPKGKAGATVHALFDVLRDARGWSQNKTDQHVDGLLSVMAAGNLTPAQEAHDTLEANLVGLIGNWKDADAARAAAAVTAASSAFDAGYASFKFAALMKAEDRKIRRDSLERDTGKTGSAGERDAKLIADHGLKGGWKDNFLSLISFEQLVQYLFGRDSAEAIRLVDLERQAAAAKEDAIQADMDALEDLFTGIAGSRFEGEKLRWELSRKSLSIGSRQLSPLEAITATLMWRQPDGQRHMLGHKDDTGAYTGKWHYDQAFIDAIEAALSPQAHAVRDHIATEYAAEWAQLNPTFVELNGINLPQNPNYSPLTVKPHQASSGQSIDPVTGSTMSGSSTTPGSLRSRGQAIAEPDFRDALQTFIAHKKQIRHWLAYAPFSAEAGPMLRNRDLGNAIESKGGEQGLAVLRSWLDFFDVGGTRDAAAHLSFNQMMNRITGRAASSILIGRMGVLAIQVTQLGAAIAEMPLGSFASRFGKLMTGQLGWGAAFRSEYIQRRMVQMPVVVQQAMDGLRSSKPTLLKYHVQKLGLLISGTDALMTAGTFAMVHDYQLKQARGMGLTAEAAEAFAMQAAERSVDRIAQPTRPGTRSLFENTATYAAAKVLWAFASESRQKLMLAIWRIAMKDRTLDEKTRAMFVTWGIGGMGAAIIRAVSRDSRDDGDDDEVFDEKNWSLKRLTIASLTGSAGGLPFIGDAIEAGVYKASGEYVPEGNLLSSMADMVMSATRVKDWDDAEADQIMKDVEGILAGAALLDPTGNAAAASSLSHIARDAFGISQNILPDD